MIDVAEPTLGTGAAVGAGLLVPPLLSTLAATTAMAAAPATIPTIRPVETPAAAPPPPAAPPAAPPDAPAAPAAAAVLTETVPVRTPPGTDAATLTPKELPAAAEKAPLDAIPVAVVVATEVSPPPANAAPPAESCGSVKATAIPATGTSFSSVILTTASELTRPFLTRLELLAPSRIVSLYFCGVAAACAGAGAC